MTHIKHHTLFIAAAALLILCLITACKKSRYCFCTSTDAENPDTVIWNLDRGLKCNRLASMGFESNVQVVDDSLSGRTHTELVQHTYKYTCVELSKDTLATFDSLHVEN